MIIFIFILIIILIIVNPRSKRNRIKIESRQSIVDFGCDDRIINVNDVRE